MSRTSTSTPTTASAFLDDPVPADLSVTLVVGQLSRPAETRELPSGDTLVALEVTSRRPDGVADSMPVIWADAPDWAGELAAGERVVVAGRVRRRFYRAGGVTTSRTEVVADRIVPARQRARTRSLVDQIRRRVESALDDPGGDLRQ